MALFKKNLPASSIQQSSDAERKVIKGQGKVNRLKRGKKSSSAVTGHGSSYNQSVISCKHVWSEAAEDIKCFSTAETFVNRSTEGALKQDDGHCSPKCDALISKVSPKQNKLKMRMMKLTHAHLQVDDDVVDLCSDEDLHGWNHNQVFEGLTGPPQAIRTRRSEEVKKASHCGSSISPTTLKSYRERSGWRKDFSAEACEGLLEQIQTQNQHFPVHRFFSLLLKRWSQFKEGTESSSAAISVKRKQAACSPRVKRPPKRQCLDGVCASVSECVNTLTPQISHHKPINTHRLSISRRKRQKNTQNTQSTMSELQQPGLSVFAAGENTPAECVKSDDDVLWTEKYQPQSSSEIIGNAASMRKLHSWLKELRMRADVEERKRRQEERRRIQEENNESWDCGDFEGEAVVVEWEVKLCNTVMICGSSGVGKTAAVYACAHELGYKVFEVNSSSVRASKVVLSQLREATQSHQVGLLQSSSTNPQNNHNRDPATPTALTGASREETCRKLSTFSRKASPTSRKAPRKRKRSSAPVRTLKHFFKRVDRPPHDAATVKPESDSKATASCKEPILDRKNRTPHISLILFEEVDIIFREDVGFLTAIKTLMSTTKRPIILTTNDPLFIDTFDGHFETIHFKTPPVETSRSYLQCLCVVESVSLDTEDVSFMLSECKGDVRRSLLELEMWTCSGQGNTRRHTQNKTLTCHSWAELERSGLVDVLVENWKMGQSLFYSNLELLFTPFSALSSKNKKTNTLKVDPPTSEKNLNKVKATFNEMRPGQLSRLKVKTMQSLAKCTHQSEGFLAENRSSQLVSSCLNSLVQFFNTFSFLDSCIYRQHLQVSGQCQPGPLGWMGAKLMDSVMDELREEEVNAHLEHSYELLAALEGLQFHQCRTELSETLRKAEEMKEVIEGDQFTQLMEKFVYSDSDASASQNVPQAHGIQKRREVINKVLSSKAFCYSNKKAFTVDYLPALRSMCRIETAEQQNTLRSLHYLSDIGLTLPKSTVRLLASDLHQNSPGDLPTLI